MKALIDRRAIDDITSRFKALAALVPLNTIQTQSDYDKAVSRPC